jgi:hypothetical protein
MSEDSVNRLEEKHLPEPTLKDLYSPSDSFDGLNPEELFSRFKDWYEDDSEHLRKWREEAKEDYAFRALDQWSEKDRESLENQKRPVITFDRINPIIRSVSGQEVNNRLEARYIPRQLGAAGVNEFLTDVAKWFRDRAAAASAETDAFEDMLTCGIGCTETRLDYDENPDGDPRIQRIDPLEMLWDNAVQETNNLDARRVWRVKDVPLSEAEFLFPGYSRAELDASWARDDTLNTTADKAGPPYYAKDGQRFPEDAADYERDTKVTLVEIQWWTRESFYRVIDPPTGQQTEVSEATFKELNDRLGKFGLTIDGVKQHRKVYRRAFIGGEVLEVGRTPCPEHFSYGFITGFRERNTRTWYGLVKAMKDPQRFANKWLSQILHILNSQASGGLMVEEGAILDEREFEEKWTKPNSLIKFKRGTFTGGANPGAVPKPPPVMPAGYFQLWELAAGASREATGVNLEQLGMREAVQPGVLEYQRRQSGIQLLAGIFDNLRRYRYTQADQMLYIIQHYLSDGRLVRIGGEQSQQYLPLVHDATVGEYDVIIDEAPTAPNQKEAVWQMFSQMLPVVGQLMTPEMWAVMLEYSPLPTAVSQGLREAMAPAPPSPEEEAAKQLEFAAQQAMVAGMEAERMKDYAQAENFRAQAMKNFAEARAKRSTAAQATATAVNQRAQAVRNVAEAGKARRETLQPQLFRAQPRPQSRPS